MDGGVSKAFFVLVKPKLWERQTEFFFGHATRRQKLVMTGKFNRKKGREEDREEKKIRRTDKMAQEKERHLN